MPASSCQVTRLPNSYQGVSPATFALGTRIDSGRIVASSEMPARKHNPKYVREQAAELDRRLGRILARRIAPAEREFIELMRSLLRRETK